MFDGKQNFKFSQKKNRALILIKNLLEVTPTTSRSLQCVMRMVAETGSTKLILFLSHLRLTTASFWHYLYRRNGSRR